MKKMNLPSNVRVASWLGARCVEAFIENNKLNDIRLQAFVNHISDLVYSRDVPEWDEKANQLEVHGLGDPLPEELDHVFNLAELIDCVREISASQIYVAFRPEIMLAYLKTSLSLSKIDLSEFNLRMMCDISTEREGFGDPLSDNIVQGFKFKRT